MGSAKLIAFAAIADAARAKAFYRDVLGLKPVHELAGLLSVSRH